MPARSKAQARFMQACAHAKPGSMHVHCPPKKVAHEFNQATKSVKDLPERVTKKEK
jgi:hypothetical protein